MSPGVPEAGLPPPTHRLHLGARAAEHPDRPAIVMTGSGEVTTYGELDERSTRLARAFRRAGLQVGDHVALMMQNSSAFLEAAGPPSGPGSTTPPSTATSGGTRPSTSSTTAAPPPS